MLAISAVVYVRALLQQSTALKGSHTPSPEVSLHKREYSGPYHRDISNGAPEA